MYAGTYVRARARARVCVCVCVCVCERERERQRDRERGDESVITKQPVKNRYNQRDGYNEYRM